MTISEIIGLIYRNTKTTSGRYDSTVLLSDINSAYAEAVDIILNADGRWEWDDLNNTDLPIATTDIVSGQRDYSIPVEFLEIQRVEIKRNGGTNYEKLEPIDIIDGDSVVDTTSTGKPSAYDVRGNSILLYPVPDYSQADSLRIYLKRGPNKFTAADVTDGSKEPGFNSLYHEYIPISVSHKYWNANDQKLADRYANDKQLIAAKIQKAYTKRNKDDRDQITTQYINHR